MELAKVTSKGQITIPAEIRKKLGLKTGDKVLFVEERGKIIMMNSTSMALHEAQKQFEGMADAAGLQNEEDVVQMIKDMRQEKGVR